MSSPTLRPWAPPLITLLSVAVVWAGRDLMPLDVFMRLLLPIVWLGIWTFACLGLGAGLVHLVSRGRLDDRPELAVILATGSVGLSVVAGLLAAAQLLRPWVLVVTLAAACAGGIVLVARRRHSLTLPRLTIEPISAFIVAGSWVLLFSTLTSPPVMFDVLHYHLAFPDRWLQAGSFTTFARHGFSFYPFGHGMAYAYGLATFGPWAASALHWWFGAVAALCAASLGTRLAGPKAGWWALALFALTPTTLEVANFAIADLTVACWTGAAFVVLLDNHRETARWTLAGILVGGAFSAKYLALATAAAPLAAAALVLSINRNRSGIWRQWVMMGVAALLVASPWLIRNSVTTGNPTYPYFSTFFGGPPSGMGLGVELSQNDLPDAGLVAGVVRAVGAAPFRTFEPLRQGGLLGLLWVILLPGALFLRKIPFDRWAPLAAATLTGLIAWGALVHFARFLLPVLVPASALAGAAAAALVNQESPTIRRSFHILLIALLAWNSTVLATQLTYDRIGVATGFVNHDDFLRTWVSYQPVIEFVNAELPEDAVLLLVSEPRGMYLDRAILVEDSYRLPWLLELADASSSAEELAQSVSRLGVTHLLVNEGHMRWSARLRGAKSYWEGASPETAHRVSEFFEHHVVRLHEGKGVWVGRFDTGGSQALIASTPRFNNASTTAR